LSYCNRTHGSEVTLFFVKRDFWAPKIQIALKRVALHKSTYLINPMSDYKNSIEFKITIKISTHLNFMFEVVGCFWSGLWAHKAGSKRKSDLYAHLRRFKDIFPFQTWSTNVLITHRQWLIVLMAWSRLLWTRHYHDLG
jgi:hypothetical protein